MLGGSVCFEVAVKMCVTVGANKQWCPLPHSDRTAVDGGIAAGSNNNVMSKRSNEYLTIKINLKTILVFRKSY
jgi:hypothetical protein